MQANFWISKHETRFYEFLTKLSRMVASQLIELVLLTQLITLRYL